MTLLEVKNIEKHYAQRPFIFKRGQETPVLQKVTFSLQEGECLGIVGQSGSGKSTLGRIILGIERPTNGEVLFQGINLYNATNKHKKMIRRDLQAVFQNSYHSFNPEQTIFEILEEPFLNFEHFSKSERQHKVRELLDCVELESTMAQNYPSQLSGGQQQRVNIARALALNPKLIVLDEAISSLDMILQKHIIQLLQTLQKDLQLAYIFISHDLQATRFLSDRILVMQHGQLVEEIGKDGAYQHPASQELYNAILPLHPRERNNKNKGFL
ncbi:ABC transporter ATP-binding protein [Lysinibacillus agricola]|uniref:ABC transporter ATP-binding protein n=1 Tax=Lysinibacillus agricola TaxID=2590012 RepID=A0ABX7ALK7_9BACI|nr:MULTISPECIES: ATP-binding cassette domain-containing protein [Lysinibacillus]KOS60487.1 peptide ABC transporter ATP-binding protein [Lysinibacillus sp. FJAT-14222]QQP10282.1 ABC transporter ATP-binding protein [Lysinibacillus agricola]